ncbi:hypothetical protein GCM10017673_28150 [Streptosporangium violaceochromogenes]|nr:hypothetical protein GCM10017673_28150 [Streptosporangium violaceochromogenes]
MTPAVQPDPGQSERSDHSIAIWGAPGSGKTTFLAALNIALILKKGPWRVIGADGPSTDFLIEMTTALSQYQRFPPATGALGHYRWFLSRRSEPPRRSWRRRRKPPRAWKIGLDVLDAPGGFFRAERTGYGTDREELIDNLAASRGIVFLFDPIRESKDGDAFAYLHGVLAELAGRMLADDEFGDGMLPHYLAVCVTKFDELRVLETAEKLSLLTPDPDDPYRFPRVDDADAEELFEALSAVSAGGNADMVLPALKQFFRPERIKFFVTSSIGFYLDPLRGVFDPDDFQNLVPEATGTAGGAQNPHDPHGPRAVSGNRFRIRGQAHPINVMEPMLWLGQRLSSGDGDAGKAGG